MTSPEHAQLVAALEQMSGLLRDFAATLGSYTRALEARGYTRAEALALTQSFQDTYFRTVLGASLPRRD